MQRPCRRYLFRLCVELGLPHPDYLMDLLTSEQISEWLAYDRLEPIGQWRADYRLGVLCALIVDIVQRLFARRGATPRRVSPIDYMPDWSGDLREMIRAGGEDDSNNAGRAESVEDMKRLFEAIATRKQSRRDSQEDPDSDGGT